MIERILATPLAANGARPLAGNPRRVAEDVLAAVLPGPGRDRLASGPVLVVTTGQQPGLFTGPLYTIYKALSAIAVAARLEQERGVPVVPVFWVAGDDHDFAEANHAWLLDRNGEPKEIVLRERPAAAPQLPLARELSGPEATQALAALDAALPDSEFKADTLAWLTAAYRPDRSLADAGAEALQALLGARGLAVFRAHESSAKRAAAPWLLKALDVQLEDGLSPVLVEGQQGRDRLRQEGEGLKARRSGEHFGRGEIARLAREAPERLSPNVLLRPVVEAALFPTVAYMGGPGELEYLPQAASLFQHVGVTAPTPMPRWSGILIESRIAKVLDRYNLSPEDLAAPPGTVEARLVRQGLPPEVTAAFASLKGALEERYAELGEVVKRLDPTLERTAQSARNQALGNVQEVEKKLVASLKRADETLAGQIARSRAAIAPNGKPQERVLTAASFLGRYGLGLVDEVAAEVARWAAAS